MRLKSQKIVKFHSEFSDIMSFCHLLKFTPSIHLSYEEKNTPFILYRIND